MNKNTTLIIGAGAAGSVTTQKCLEEPDVFGDIHLDSMVYDIILQAMGSYFRNLCFSIASNSV